MVAGPMTYHTEVNKGNGQCNRIRMQHHCHLLIAIQRHNEFVAHEQCGEGGTGTMSFHVDRK
jgi:hypothetical protein